MGVILSVLLKLAGGAALAAAWAAVVIAGVRVFERLLGGGFWPVMFAAAVLVPVGLWWVDAWLAVGFFGAYAAALAGLAWLYAHPTRHGDPAPELPAEPPAGSE